MGAEQSKLLFGESAIKSRKDVSFFINGEEFRINPEKEKISAMYKLLDFIRDKAGLKGTKFMCREGGCGACTVKAKSKDPATGSTLIRAVNSCLVPVLSADGWEILTVEGVGQTRTGLGKVQESIVKFSATQCGFCTPGFVMSMQSLMEANPSVRMAEVEEALDGNLCRCTGYRPILDAFKALASDASETLKSRASRIGVDCSKCPSLNRLQDIEELEICEYPSPLFLSLGAGDGYWMKVTSLNELFVAVNQLVQEKQAYKLVAGNTGISVFDDPPYAAYIDISSVPELKESILSTSKVELGSGLTYTSAISLLTKAANLPGYEYLSKVAQHLRRVAGTPVRNLATLAGNLMLKHAYHWFTSDLYVLLEAIDAKLRIGSHNSTIREYTVSDFMQLDMYGKVVVSILFPKYPAQDYRFMSYKISQRYQSSLAYVNAGFLFGVKTEPQGLRFSGKQRIAFGGTNLEVNPEFVHPKETERYLEGKIVNQATLTGALVVLGQELHPDGSEVYGPAEYKRTLGHSLLYKAFLDLLGTAVNAIYTSGGSSIKYNLSHGNQSYSTDPTAWPVNKPIPKLEAAMQATGQVEYVNDVHIYPGELQGAFVLTTVGNAKIQGLDPFEALSMPGVKRFVTAADIPGLNNYAVLHGIPELIFAEDQVTYAGQPVGLILAESREVAFEAAKKVKVTYRDVAPPVIEIRQNVEVETPGETVRNADGSVLIKGEYRTHSQYHLTLETQSSLCIPTEDGLEVFSATQAPNLVQVAIAAATKLPMKDIAVKARQVGGGYGCKNTKSAHVAAAAAVAVLATQKPVRIVMPLEANMRMIGKRPDTLTRYAVKVTPAGDIISLNGSIVEDTGSVSNEPELLIAGGIIQSCYRIAELDVDTSFAVTNKPPSVETRAPGSMEAIATIETIMSHIAHTLNMDPIELKIRNFLREGDPIHSLSPNKEVFKGENPLPGMVRDLLVSADYDERRAFVKKCNENNRWRKRGMALVPMRWGLTYLRFNVKFPVFISVYAMDGTVTVKHGGVEMGQGINTKCGQVVAKTLDIPLSKVRVAGADTVIGPNAASSNASMSSDIVCYGAIKACEILLEKMSKVKSRLKNPSWEELVVKSYNEGVLLTAQYQARKEELPSGYNVWGVCLSEVEVDVLTGEYKIVRTDLVQDAGKSLSPEVDIGQVEGAFVMGLGLHTSEKILFNKETGELLTYNTWKYKPPFSKDIPEDFRVTLLKGKPNPLGVLGSKGTGEPGVCLAISVLLALREAIDSARKDGGTTDWYQLDSPARPEDVLRLTLTNPLQFKL